jgi:oligopeptide transport system substrate-binding protein
MKPWFTLLSVILLATASCRDASDQNAVAVSVIGAKPRLADPNRMALDAPVAVVTSAVAQGLVRFDASGQIITGLAESWAVTDDGLSYIFRIKRALWSDGRKITAREVAAGLNAVVRGDSSNRIKSYLKNVTEIVAMTEWVVEIRLSSAQPYFLQLLAQPEMAILGQGKGSGPYRIHKSFPNAVTLRPAPLPDQPADEIDDASLALLERRVRGEGAASAVARFRRDQAALVLGGNFDNLPLVQAANIREQQFKRDNTPGLFGFVVSRTSTLLRDKDMRRALAMGIDRPRLLSRFGLGNWQATDTLLPGPLAPNTGQYFPEWSELNMASRRARGRELVTRVAKRGIGEVQVSVFLPNGPGGRLLFGQIAADWSALGVKTVRAPSAAQADLILIDSVAAYRDLSWYFAQLSCDRPILCSEEADAAMSDALKAENAADRISAYSRADRALVDSQIYLPLAAPIRWSLAHPRLTGFFDNGFGHHPLDRLFR